MRVHLAACGSTQDEVRTRLADMPAGSVVSVSCDLQRDGRGRDGRRWEAAAGSAVLLSVGVQGPMSVDVLEELPRRVAEAAIEALPPGAADHVAWKSPNDLVDSAGAKLAGILVDARSTGAQVDHVIVGIGLNANGAAFTTTDGRAATSLEQLTGTAVDVDALTQQLVLAIARELGASAPR